MLGQTSLATATLAAQDPFQSGSGPVVALPQAKILGTSQLLAGDQTTSAHVYAWDTPYSALESSVASNGLEIDVREPVSVSTWLTYLADLKAATAAGLAAAFIGANTVATVSNGRVANLQESWSGGAPAWYGATQRGRVAMHWRCELRPVVGRSWFSTDPTPEFSLAFGGNGWLRVTKTVSGVTTEVLIGGVAGTHLTETDYLTDGLVFSAALSTLAAGDSLDVYYVQSTELWGGIVAKVVAGGVPEQTQALAREAPVLGSGLFDDGEVVTMRTFPSWESIEVTHELGGASSATVNVPLLNPRAHDGFGFEWRRTSDGDDPGQLRVWDGGAIQYTLRRGQLIRVTGGLVDEEYVLMTGVIDDFEPGDGTVGIRCIGFESRPLKAITKNEPDEISYMTFGYRKQRGTTEPVFAIPAYDGWHIEHACQDILYRTGIDASRFFAPYVATGADGAAHAVEYDGVAYLKFRARSASNTDVPGGTKLRLERPVHYGNIGVYFDDARKPDDPYVFVPEDTKEPWSRVREIADRYGYDIRFDHLGDCVLWTRGNAAAVVDASTALAAGTGEEKTHPSAYRGTYIEWDATENPLHTFTFSGSRVDVSVPRGPYGNWAYFRVVRVSDEVEVARVSNVSGAHTSDVFYYDYRTTTTGINATMVPLYSGPYDEYRVECKGSTVLDGQIRRLDSFWIWAIDPLASLYPAPLTTDQNALSVQGASSGDDMRNLVYVVGRRKAAVTDSDKFEINPNNPDVEFIVEVAVDTGSISDPAAKNYVGGKHEAAIFDDSIADPEYAAYLARVFVYRYRTPKPPAEIRHTILPVLELRDPLFAIEAKYRSVDELYTLWATKYSHSFGRDGSAFTSISTSAWPEFPSYEQREDVDIDARFADANGVGVPVTNVEVSYTSLSGHVQTNLDTDEVESSLIEDIVEVSVDVSAGSPEYLDMDDQAWPPIPGTVFLAPNDGTSTPWLTQPDVISGSMVGNDLMYVPPGGSFPLLHLPDAISLTEVLVTTWRRQSGGNKYTASYKVDRVLTATQDPANASGFWYEFNTETKKVLVHYVRPAVSQAVLNAMPEFLSFKATFVRRAGVNAGNFVTDAPYHHFMNVDYRDANRRIYLPWKQGDGSLGYERNPDVTSYTVKYRKLGPVDGGGTFVDPYVGGNCPFADPTTSELGHVCTIRFDALVSGLYNIQIRSVKGDVIVAYLTEPTADTNDPQAHWAYVTAGPDREFVWDYSDQVGVWNRRQSADYSASIQGSFELAEKEPIGTGWYVWNLDLDNGKLGPLALISGERDALGKPVFGQGTYAEWYVHVEVKNDVLEDIAEGTALPYPRVVKTLPPVTGAAYSTPAYSDAATTAIIYTHLPEPVQAELTVADWISVTPYDPDDADMKTNPANWGAVDTDATINNAQPVRMQFTVKGRPGTLWASHQSDVECRVTRHVHMRNLIFDQFVVLEGVSYPETDVEQRTVYTRRLCEDQHTLTFVDQGWRRASTFRNATYTTGTVQWVFTPSDFKKKFGDVENESIDFGNYLQIAEVPKWEAHRLVAGANSRFIMGFLGYLFYLSAYVQDRSGRRVWCTNRQFLDQSKICTNAVTDWWEPGDTTTPPTVADADNYRADWPADPQRQQRRTVVCRQWTDEPGWHAEQKALWGFSTNSIGDLLLRHKWEDHEPGSTTLAGVAWPALDIDYHSKWHMVVGRTQLSGGGFGGAPARQLGAWADPLVTTRLGTWLWEEGPLWIPSVERDWFPYYLLPPMPSPPNSTYAVVPDDGAGFSSNLYAIVDHREYNADSNEGEDAAQGPTWTSWARDMKEVYNAAAGMDVARVRFKPGSRIDTKQDPNKPTLSANALDYVRQDELVHFEDLRGIYTHGPRPAEQPQKVTPVAPYFLNPMAYMSVTVGDSVPTNAPYGTHSKIPEFTATMLSWFRLGFRSEYIVESPAWFPTKRLGEEFLAGMLPEITRYPTDETVFFDTGAWTGWKDDLDGGQYIGTTDGLFGETDASRPGAYDQGFQRFPYSIGPYLPQTKDVYLHLTLVNERREIPL